MSQAQKASSCDHVIMQIFGYYHDPLRTTKDIMSEKSASYRRNVTDRRMGYAVHFNFCPFCGEKLNWRKIRKEVL